MVPTKYSVLSGLPALAEKMAYSGLKAPGSLLFFSKRFQIHAVGAY